MAGAPDLVDLVIRLSCVKGRAAAARELAREAGAEDLLAFVRDTVVNALVPARGFPQTLAGGSAWRAFLARCDTPGRQQGEVDLPVGTFRPAVALVGAGATLVLVGGAPASPAVDQIERLLPLVEALLCAEHTTLVAAAEAEESREAASRATALAAALDAARAHAAKLNADLREEHRRKDDFLAMLAHELRNPLAPVVTALELLRLRPHEPTAVRRQVEVMERQIAMLSRLVEDLLDVSRISRGRMELRRERLELRDVLADALEASRPLRDARGHRCELLLPEEPLTVDADRLRLSQVLANLLNNAAKYTERGGRIVLAAERAGDHAVIRVHDNGIGISPEILHRIFDLFVQAPAALAQAQGGLGIGLTLARSFVQLHGGELTAESPGLGQGSTFTVRLPLAKSDAVESAPAAPSGAVERATHGLRVLVVDDNRDAADTLAAMLELLGHQPAVAYTGSEGLRLAAEIGLDLAILDIGLPGLDGYDVARHLRRSQPETLLVALTGYGTSSDRRRSRDAGFDEHFVKPLAAEDLQCVLQRASAARERGRPPPGH